jgi:hypothetical protein
MYNNNLNPLFHSLYLVFLKNPEKALGTIQGMQKDVLRSIQDTKGEIDSFADMIGNPEALAKVLDLGDAKEVSIYLKSPEIKPIFTRLKSNTLTQFNLFKRTIARVGNVSLGDLVRFTVRNLRHIMLKLKSVKERAKIALHDIKNNATAEVKKAVELEKKRTSLLLSLYDAPKYAIQKVFKDVPGNEDDRIEDLVGRDMEGQQFVDKLYELPHEQLKSLKPDEVLSKTTTRLTGIAKEMLEMIKTPPVINDVVQYGSTIRIIGTNIQSPNIKITPSAFGWDQIVNEGSPEFGLSHNFKSDIDSSLRVSFAKYPKEIKDKLIATILDKIDIPSLLKSIGKKLSKWMMVIGTEPAGGFGSYENKQRAAQKRAEETKKKILAQNPYLDAKSLKAVGIVVGPRGERVDKQGAKKYYVNLAKDWNSHIEKDESLNPMQKNQAMINADQMELALEDSRNPSLSLMMNQGLLTFLNDRVEDESGKVRFQFFPPETGGGAELIAMNFEEQESQLGDFSTNNMDEMAV